jgi:hypothetical protein
MAELRGDEGEPLGVRPTHLVVPPSLEKRALELLNAANNAEFHALVCRIVGELAGWPCARPSTRCARRARWSSGARSGPTRRAWRR